MREVESPTRDKYAEYDIDYKAQFRSSDVSQAQVEIWISSDGQVAIGLEETHRVAERLGVAYRRRQFAAGHEPLLMSESGMLLILDLVADGEIAISAVVAPVLGLVDTSALLLNDDAGDLLARVYPQVEWANWIKRTPRRASRPMHRLVKYEAWS